MIRRLLRASSLALSLASVAVPTASAKEESSIRIAQPVMRDCAGQLLPSGSRGAATEAWTAPAKGILTASLEGDLGSDWDLAVFRDDAPAGASTSFGSIEKASVPVEDGDAVVAQACRRDGELARAPLTLEFDPLSEPPPPERISMESVAISSLADVERLEQMGFDVTHDVSPSEATLVLYSDAQRALLASAGFVTRTEIPDLVAADNAQRSADLRAAPGSRSALPSGRDTYRLYEDYTTEMNDLAGANPGIVREVVLGMTFEGRPIQGIEIADDVSRQDDGRPVYLNFGAHHAREWPSAEWPMEFAHTLVQGYNASDARIRDLLAEVRVVIVPVVNVDGFIASRSYGFNPATDDDSILTAGQAFSNQAAYIRKNCRPTQGDGAIPCAQRTFSGVDLNRNYGYYWGGPGSTSDTTAQSYRGSGPFSEPESEAVHRYTSSIHPTVFITNHTFTTDGKWLRQPGFDPDFLPQATIADYESQGCGPQSTGDQGAITPDETAMKDLGDDMAAATGFTSELGYETLCDITGATEDWNYFAQGTYGYTPEARGTNFHMNYATGVVTEYLGDATHAGLGVREAYLVAGERAADSVHHGIIRGAAPPGATLKLTKNFVSPTFSQPALNVKEQLETTLTVPAAGTYEWHVNPSDRPAVLPTAPPPVPGDEQWTMTCQRPGSAVPSTLSVEVARGQEVTVNWTSACGTDAAQASAPVSAPCRKRSPTIVGTTRNDVLRGTPGADVIAPLAGDDRVSGLGGDDTVCGSLGEDRINGGSGADTLMGNKGDDRLNGGAGGDLLGGGQGDDRVSGGAGKDRCNAGSGGGTLSRCP